MSKKAGRRTHQHKPATPEAPPPSPDVRAPLKRRPRLFYSLLAVLAAWVIGLVVLYATTVYPNRPSAEKAQVDPAGDAPQGTVSQ